MAKLSGFANTLEEALGPIDFPVHSRQEEPTTRQAAERQRGGGGGEGCSPGRSGGAPKPPQTRPAQRSSSRLLSEPWRQRLSPSRPAPPCCAPLEAGGIAQHAETRRSAWRGSKLAPSREFRRNRMWQKERLGSGPRH